MRILASVCFVILGAVVFIVFVRQIFDTVSGVTYLIPLLLCSGIVYLFIFDLIHGIAFPGINPNLVHSSSSRQQYVFGIALVVSAFLIVLLDFYYSTKYEKISAQVVEKTRLTRGRVSIRRVDCHEIELESGIRQCVDPRCWHSVELGDEILIEPKYGLFSLSKLNVQCEKAS